jgi:hypothetical protein
MEDKIAEIDNGLPSLAALLDRKFPALDQNDCNYVVSNLENSGIKTGRWQLNPKSIGFEEGVWEESSKKDDKIEKLELEDFKTSNSKSIGTLDNKKYGYSVSDFSINSEIKKIHKSFSANYDNRTGSMISSYSEIIQGRMKGEIRSGLISPVVSHSISSTFQAIEDRLINKFAKGKIPEIIQKELEKQSNQTSGVSAGDGMDDEEEIKDSDKVAPKNLSDEELSQKFKEIKDKGKKYIFRTLVSKYEREIMAEYSNRLAKNNGEYNDEETAEILGANPVTLLQDKIFDTNKFDNISGADPLDSRLKLFKNLSKLKKIDGKKANNNLKDVTKSSISDGGINGQKMLSRALIMLILIIEILQLKEI